MMMSLVTLLLASSQSNPLHPTSSHTTPHLPWVCVLCTLTWQYAHITCPHTHNTHAHTHCVHSTNKVSHAHTHTNTSNLTQCMPVIGDCTHAHTHTNSFSRAAGVWGETATTGAGHDPSQTGVSWGCFIKDALWGWVSLIWAHQLKPLNSLLI